MNEEGTDPRPRVVVADDHAPTRAGIRAVLEADGWQVLGEAASAEQLLALVAAAPPDVALVDIHMPGSGIAAAEELGRRHPDVAVVALTYSSAEDDVFGALRAGARGYLLKDMDPQRLGAALRGVLAGEAAIPRSLAARVLDEFRRGPGRRVRLPGRGRTALLTDREYEVMDLLRQGLTTAQVADKLVLSQQTVRVHISNALKKLRVRDRESAVRMLDQS